MGYTQAAPLILAGAGGTFTLDFTTGDFPQWVTLTPAGGGSLAMSATTPAGWLPTFTVLDSDGDQMAVETDGTLGLIWSAGELMQVSIEPGLTEPAPYTSVEFTWSYAARASSPLIVAAETYEILETPGAFVLTISNGIPGDVVTFSLVGPSATADFQTIALDDAGGAEDVAVMLPGINAGIYYLRVEGATSGSEDVEITVLEDALSFAGSAIKPVPTPPDVDPALHWRFFDLRDPDTTYTMPRNPRSWSNVYPPNDFTHEKTTAPAGQALTWQAAARPWRMEFTGYLDTQQQYDALVFWTSLRRRFWLVDHRNRAWLVTFEHFDAQHRIVPNVPWAHNYTVKALIFLQGEMA